MDSAPLQILAVVGSPRRNSVTRVAIHFVSEKLRGDGCTVDVLDLGKNPLPFYDPDTSEDLPHFEALQKRVERAEVIILGTPDYHGSISGTLKNFLDHFWREFGGKLFAALVASHEKGLTVVDQLRTIARQCYAWTLPYAVAIADGPDVQNDQLTEGSRKRLEMFARDLRVYGALLAQQRRLDLAGSDPGFLARWRKQQPVG